jgi:hypothetical protein
MSWLKAWFGYRLGASAAKAIFGEPERSSDGPIREQTEEQIRADEKRFDEDAKRLDAEDTARKRRER